MKIKLDYHSSQPLYQQAVLQIKRLIVTKRIKPGEKLPSIRVLAKELQLNPTTTNRIFSQLAKEGIVVQRPGLGVFVSETPTPFSAEYIQTELNRQALAFLVEGLRFGLEYAEISTILDQQYQILKQETK
ncbi:MAG: GntR family transcriptional regulator, partial [Planctomycetaceae bacterium]|jgi:GntR family transcriptional regulator|nr:GntR family transcriptional regulator [Planctomycetaceae bacterium]